MSVCCDPELQGLEESVVGQEKLPHPALKVPGFGSGRFVSKDDHKKNTLLKIASSETGERMVFRLNNGSAVFKVEADKENRKLLHVIDVQSRLELGTVEISAMDLADKALFLKSEPSVTIEFGQHTFQVVKMPGLKGDYVSDGYNVLWNQTVLYEACADASTEEFVLRLPHGGTGDIIGLECMLNSLTLHAYFFSFTEHKRYS